MDPTRSLQRKVTESIDMFPVLDKLNVKLCLSHQIGLGVASE
jgi:hypothetical protein